MAMAVPAFAPANPDSNGHGQTKEGAAENCQAAIDKQTANGVSAVGGPKEGQPGPTNCEHIF